MSDVIKIIVLVIGIVLGVRVGVRQLFTFWSAMGLLYIMMNAPLSCYEMGTNGFHGSENSKTIGVVMLVISILFILWFSIRFSGWLWRRFGFDSLSEGIDHAIGGALGGAVGWILATLML